MTRTPDAHPGELLEDDGIILADTSDPTVTGELRYYGGFFKAKDGTGTFNLRTGGPHAPTHSEDGSDQVLAQDLGSGTAAEGQLLQADGTGGWDLVDYVPGVPPELTTGESTTPFSTSSGTYQQAWRYTTPALLGGTYFIAVQAWLDTTNAGNVTDARIQIDDTTTIASWVAPVGYVGGTTPLIGVATGVLSAGAHNIDFDIRKVSGLGNVIIKRFYVTIWKVM